MAKGTPTEGQSLDATGGSFDEGVLVLSPDYSITFVNEYLANSRKLKHEAILGKKCYEVFHERQSICDDCPAKKAIITKKPASTVRKGKNANGLEIHAVINAYPIADSNGRITQIIETVRDIKPHLETEKKLIEKSRELGTIFDNAPLGISLLDKEMRYVRINNFIENIIGLKSDEVRGEHCYDVVGQYRNDRTKSGRERICDVCNVVKALETGEIHKHLREYSPNMINENIGVPIKDGDEVIGVMEIIRDITKEKKLEKELRGYAEELEKKVEERTKELKKSEEKYRGLVETNPDGIFVVDRKSGKIIGVNDAVCKLLAYKKSEIIGTRAGSRVLTSQKQAFNKQFKKHQKGGKFSGEFVLKRKDGRTISVDVKGSAFGDYLLAVVRDITERKRAEDALRESEEKYKRLVLQNRDAIFVGRSDGSISYASPACRDIFGYAPEEFMGDPLIAAKIVHPDYRQQFNKFWEDYARTKKFRKEPLEWAWIRKDGKIIYTENTFTDTYNEKGEVIGFQTVARDITERKHAEKALRESEEIYRSLFQNANDGIVTIDLDGNYRLPNPKFCTISGYTREELDGKHFSKIVHPDDKHIVGKNRALRVKGKTAPESYEYRIITKDANIRYVESRPSVIIKEGKIAGVQTVIRDRTDKKRQEKELTTLLDISRNISNTLELNSLLVAAVKEIVDATGADRVSVLLVDEAGRGHVPVAYTKSGEQTGAGNQFDLSAFRSMKEAVEKKRTVYVKDSLSSKTQSSTEIALAKNLNIGSGIHVPLIARGKVFGLLNFAAIGKAKKFTEHEIRFYETIANELSAMIANSNLYEATKLAKNEAEFYVDLMSHDINNANTVAMGMLELLAEHAKMRDQKDYLNKSIVAIRRSINIIDNVRKIQMTKLTGKVAFEKRYLNSILREVIRDVKNFHSDKVVKINYAPKKAWILTDGLVRDLFWNIVDNAAKYDPHQEIEIDVEVSGAGKEWLVKVKDRGRGIPDDFKTVIFERFRRLDTGIRGSGVGLYLCKLLTDKYGGRIWVENRVKGEYRHGSVFIVALPKA